MITRRRSCPVVIGAAALLALLTACGDEDRTHTEFNQAVQRRATSTDDANPQLSPIAPGAASPRSAPGRIGTLELTLASLGETGLAGSARLAQVGSGTSVFVSLGGAEGGSTYAGAIRQGECSRIGGALGSLVPITADSLGSGRSASDLPFPLDSLRGGAHVLVFGRGQRPEICGAL